MAREILSKKDYYDILSVTKQATEEDVKKAYKKFAIKLHPDKNHAPRASDAFKKVSAAYACLTDKEKRRIYDHTGSDPGQGTPSPSGRGGRRGGFNEEEINPEDIFNMFFGGGAFGES